MNVAGKDGVLIDNVVGFMFLFLVVMAKKDPKIKVKGKMCGIIDSYSQK